MAWLIKFDPRAAKELKKLDPVVQKRIIAYLKNLVAIQNNPRFFGKNLTGDKRGLWRYRVGYLSLLKEIYTLIIIPLSHQLYQEVLQNAHELNC